MERLESRIERLENLSRNEAISRIKNLFDELTDWEVALGVASISGIELSVDQEEQRARAERRLLNSGVEVLLSLAVCPEECRSEEQIKRRLRDLNERVLYAGGRKERLQHLLQDLENGAM